MGARVRIASIERKWWVLVAIGAGTFMSALDGSVVNTTLPVIRQTFGSDVAAVEWIVTIYLLLLSGLLLSFGRLGDLQGHRPVYLAGFGIFIGSSMLCGLAPSVAALIAFRALQAIGAAMLSANSPAILTKSFPAEQRGQALGLQATMTYLGLTVGPSLGGWLADVWSWRAVFYINVPVGLAALLLSLRFVPHDEPNRRAEPFDFTGAGLFMGGLVALLLGLNQGHAWGWTSLPILGLLAASIILLALFAVWEGRVRAPMLDLSLFASRIFSTSTLSAVFNYICVYSITFLMPFFLIQGRELSAGQAGLLLSTMPVVMAVVAPISGSLSDRLGARLPSSLGMIILASGLFLLSRLGAASPIWHIVLAMAVSGLGIGIFISPNSSALMGAAPRNRQGIASGILATARNVGMVLGVGLAGAIYTTVLAQRQAEGGAAIFAAVSASFLAAVVAAVLGLAATLIRGETGNGRTS